MMSVDFMVREFAGNATSGKTFDEGYRLIRHYFRSYRNACLKHIHLFTVNHFTVTAVTIAINIAKFRLIDRLYVDSRERIRLIPLVNCGSAWYLAQRLKCDNLL